jgi:hypothetical protein
MKHLITISSLLLTTALLSACGGSDSKPKPMSSSSAMMSSMAASSEMMSSVAASEMASSAASSMVSLVSVKYSVTVTNLTAGQPISPVAFALHQPEFSAFKVGMPASLGLEKIAESGDATDYLAAVSSDAMVMASGKADGGIMPGGNTMVMVDASVDPEMMSHLSLSMLAMLGNTNDGFTGLNAIKLGQLDVGQSMTLDAISYDAGTEWNAETAETVPGPAAGGEGFNAERSDANNQVTMHPGLVTKDDGKADSALTNLQKWDNPVARITITRMAP